MILRRKDSAQELRELREQVQELTQHVIELRRRFNKLPDRLAGAVHPVLELSKLSDVPVQQAVFGGTALPAASALKLVLAVAKFQPRNIAEFGSGQSTAWLGQALAHQGEGKLTSFEHHPDFHQETRENIHSRHFADYVDLRLAELTPLSSGGEWYDPAQMEDLHEIDMVMIDGPPKRGNKDARYPALPMLAPKLASGCNIFVDDAHAGDMKWTIERWLDEFPLTVMDAAPESERLLHLRFEGEETAR